MSDVAITGTNTKVTNQATTRRSRIQYGGTVTHAQPVYKHTDNKHYAADNDDTAVKAVVVGVALTPGVADDWGDIVTEGPMVVGGTLIAGTEYYLSSNVGGICPRSDLGTSDYITRIGVATSTTVLNVKIDATGVQVP